MSKTAARPYHLFMLGLCVYVLAALFVQTFFSLDGATIAILDYADTAICGIFLLDFINSLARAENRLRYFIRWGWLDLISSIPTVDVFRWGRAARVFRILRVLRAFRATRLLSAFVLKQRARSAFWATLLFAVLVTIFGSVAILHLEAGAERPNITTAADALWWSFVTMTTVGYGDHYPVTPSGRALAAILMVVGIGLFGTFTAFVASTFLASEGEIQKRDLEALREEVRELKDSLAKNRMLK